MRPLVPVRTVPLRAEKSMVGSNGTSSGFAIQQFESVHTRLLKGPCVHETDHTYLLQTLAQAQPDQRHDKKVYGSIVGMETWNFVHVSASVRECMHRILDGIITLPPLDKRNEHTKIAAMRLLFHVGFKRRSDWRLNHPLGTYSLATSEETACA